MRHNIAMTGQVPQKFAGIQCSAGSRFVDFCKRFDVEYDGDEQFIAVSKRTFHHQEDDLDFHYKYVIEVIDWLGNGYYAEKDNMVATLHLMPIFKDVQPKLKAACMDSLGIEDEARVMFSDMLSYGGMNVSMGTMAWTYKECNPFDSKEMEDCLYAITNTYEIIDGLRGFYLDKYWNMMGSTGWDTIYHFAKGNDLFQAAIDRYHESQKL